MSQRDPTPEDNVWDLAQFQSPEKGLDGSVWPISPRDGFLPNSIIRGKGPKQEEPVSPRKPATPRGLQRKFDEEEGLPDQTLDVSHIRSAARAGRLTMPPKRHSPKIICVPPVEEEPESESEEFIETMCEIHESLRKILQNILNKLQGADINSFEEYSRALQNLFQTHPINSDLKEYVRTFFLGYVHDVEAPWWRQLGGLKNLDALQLLQEMDLTLLGSILTASHHELRKAARGILNHVFHITDKTTLKGRLQEQMPEHVLQPLLKQLTEDLELITVKKPGPKETKKADKAVIQESGKVIPAVDRIEGTAQDRESERAVSSRQEPLKKESQAVVEKRSVLDMKERSRVVDMKEQTIVLDMTETCRVPDQSRFPDIERSKVRHLKVDEPVQERTKPGPLPLVSPGAVGSSRRRQYKQFKLMARPRTVAEVEDHKQEAPVCDELLMYIYRRSRKLTAPSTCSPVAPRPRSDPLQGRPRSDALQGQPRDPGPLISREKASSSLHKSNWRECLHKLVSEYGFRSQSASEAAWIAGFRVESRELTLSRLLSREKFVLGQRIRQGTI